MAFGENLHIKFLRICRWNQLKFGTQIQTRTRTRTRTQTQRHCDDNGALQAVSAKTTE